MHREFGLTDAEALELYYAMLVSRELSETALKLAFQGAIDVSIPSDGHEAAQIASMRALRPTDPVYLFYRSAPAAYARGMSAREIFLDYFGRRRRPVVGRQEPGRPLGQARAEPDEHLGVGRDADPARGRVGAGRQTARRGQRERGVFRRRRLVEV